MKTITKAYDSYEKAHNVVDQLQTAGIAMDAISILGGGQAVDQYRDRDQSTEAGAGAGLGATVGGAAGLLAGLGLLAIPGLGPVVAAGWLASTVAGAAAGGATGGIVGSFVDAGVPEDHAHVYSEAVRRGGTVVSVRAEDYNIDTVQAILNDYDPIDPAQLGAKYRASGWNQFNPKAGPYESTRTAAARDQSFNQYTED